jgi:hypothetical protein
VWTNSTEKDREALIKRFMGFGPAGPAADVIRRAVLVEADTLPPH